MEIPRERLIVIPPTYSLQRPGDPPPKDRAFYEAVAERRRKEAEAIAERRLYDQFLIVGTRAYSIQTLPVRGKTLNTFI
ncbi:Uncharacterised protein [uncultured archaeon]|nr:Uncharacterised protein [uncultured archaeon]